MSLSRFLRDEEFLNTLKSFLEEDISKCNELEEQLRDVKRSAEKYPSSSVHFKRSRIAKHLVWIIGGGLAIASVSTAMLPPVSVGLFIAALGVYGVAGNFKFIHTCSHHNNYFTFYFYCTRLLKIKNF